jgi:FtsP/CotA-like multicopper oxidase with cupredoxin domain
VEGPQERPRFAGLAEAVPTATRKLYFSENDTTFFITVDGQTPTAFGPDNPPAIVTRQGSVEDWTIENRSQENHEFHIHQIHFLVQSQDNFAVNGSQPVAALDGQMADMIDIPFWDGNPAHPYPSVTVRMDFRGPDTGDFVYHCHILEHEDGGMMAIIRVLPGPPTAPKAPSHR